MEECHAHSDDDTMCRRRAQRLFKNVRRWLPDHTVDVLDFGGGDGRLMQPFLDRGHRCFLIDYNQQPFAGVQKLGDTIEDLAVGHLFDLIVCNHVIEHVAEPTVLLRRLATHIRPDHHLFIEVPMEIWRKPPVQSEPVTHINFFVPGSLRHCMQRAGLMVNYSRLGAYLNQSGQVFPAIHAVGRRCNVAVSRHCNSGWNELAAFLQPSFLTRVRRVWATRENLPAMVAYKFGNPRKVPA
jgi:SAM-dependent methyltransferase